MAEVVVKPKAFTKEWFGYVWDYYKWHIIIGIVAVALLAMTVVHLCTDIKYDTNINFISSGVITQDEADKIAKLCAENSDDLNNNHRVDISFTQLNFTEENKKNPQMYSALSEKRMALYASEDELIFIVDAAMFSEVVESKYTKGMFFEADEWAEGEYTKEGAYAVSLKSSTAFKEAGVDSSDMYILVAVDRDEELTSKEKNAIKIANFLIK